MKHNCYPRILCPLIYRILRSDGEQMTVFSDENYPQYLAYEGKENDGDTIRPMTKEDKGDPIERPGFFTLLKNLILNVVKIVLEQIKKIFM